MLLYNVRIVKLVVRSDKILGRTPHDVAHFIKYTMHLIERIPFYPLLELLNNWFDIESFMSLIQSRRVKRHSAVDHILVQSESSTEDKSLSLIVTEKGLSGSCKEFVWFRESYEHKSLMKAKNFLIAFSKDQLLLSQIECFDTTQIYSLDVSFSQPLTMLLDQEMALFIGSLPNVNRIKICEKTLWNDTSVIYEHSVSSLDVQTQFLIPKTILEKFVGTSCTTNIYNLVIASSILNFNLTKLSITIHTLWNDQLCYSWLLECPNLVFVKLVCDVTEMIHFNAIDCAVHWVTNSPYIQEFSIMATNRSNAAGQFIFHKSNKLCLHGFNASNDILEALFLLQGNFNVVSLRNVHKNAHGDNQTVVRAIIEGSIMTLNMLRIHNSDGLLCVSNNGMLNAKLVSVHVLEENILNIALRLLDQVPMEASQALLEQEGYFNFHLFVEDCYEAWATTENI
jgi:hypothetical protein